MNIDQEKMIVEALPSLYPLKNFEEEAIHAVLDAIPHWIPVTERLPEKLDYYLVSGNNSVWLAQYESGRFLGVLSGHALDTVIAWMPLPEPTRG